MSRLVKVAIVGASGVGKTSYTQHLRLGGNFDPSVKPPVTHFFDFFFEKEYDVVAASETVKLRLFDFQGTCGSDADHQQALLRLKALARDAHVVLFFYDVTRAATFAAVRDIWAPHCRDVCTEDPVSILVGNKLDLVDTGKAVRAVAQEEVKALGTAIGAAHCFEVSAHGDLKKLKLPLDIALTEWLKREPRPAETAGVTLSSDSTARNKGDCC